VPSATRQCDSVSLLDFVEAVINFDVQDFTGL
jgi:hypothetical protein